MITRLHDCTAARLHGCKAAWLHGCMAAWLQGCLSWNCCKLLRCWCSWAVMAKLLLLLSCQSCIAAPAMAAMPLPLQLKSWKGCIAELMA